MYGGIHGIPCNIDSFMGMDGIHKELNRHTMLFPELNCRTNKIWYSVDSVLYSRIDWIVSAVADIKWLDGLCYSLVY